MKESTIRIPRKKTMNQSSDGKMRRNGLGVSSNSRKVER